LEMSGQRLRANRGVAGQKSSTQRDAKLIVGETSGIV
jgi:hypothetical protein